MCAHAFNEINSNNIERPSAYLDVGCAAFLDAADATLLSSVAMINACVCVYVRLGTYICMHDCAASDTFLAASAQEQGGASGEC